MNSYTFSHTNDYDGAEVTYSFDAESIHDVLDHMKYFLRGCGFEVNGDICLFPDESEVEQSHGFDNIPNNSWPFGESKPAAAQQAQANEKGWYEWVQQDAPVKGIQALTSADLSFLVTTDLYQLQSHQISQYKTMAPLEALTSEQIKSFTLPMPGTLGGASYTWPNNAN